MPYVSIVFSVTALNLTVLQVLQQRLEDRVKTYSLLKIYQNSK
jgi:hypothetical protein